MAVKYQDGGYGWLIVLGTSLNHMIFGIVGRSIGIYYLEFKEHFGTSATATAWIAALCMGLWNGLGKFCTLHAL